MPIVAAEVVENNWNDVNWVFPVVVEPLILEQQVTLAVRWSSILSRQMVMISYWSLCSKWFAANETICCPLMLCFLLLTQYHWLYKTKNCVDAVMFLKQTVQERFHNLLPSIDHWLLCMLWCCANNHVAES